MKKIDFVVLWVDSNDKEWQKTRIRYEKEIKNTEYIDNSEARYRDWDLFKYWFRGVEEFAPWVNKVHLVTCGHLPKWINKNHPKLNIVKHSDIMPEEALPTFNSNSILLSVHKIPGLAEQFVLFNDDMFLTAKTKPTDFFRNGIPVNTMSLLAITPSGERQYCRTLVNNIEMINSHFNFNEFKKNNLLKCFSIKQGRYLLTTLPLLAYKEFPGFKNYHIGISYLKSTFEKVWELEPEPLERTVMSRFRNYENDVSEWVMNYWQFASGNFLQKSYKFGVNTSISNSGIDRLIRKRKHKILCINDGDDIYNFDELKIEIQSAFYSILSRKSNFEV